MIAIIVPYRDRLSHLRIFSAAIAGILGKETYQLFVIEQLDNNPFNRGALLNAGFDFCNKLGLYDYFVMHDVDMVPVFDKVDYSFPHFPTHLATKCSQFNYQMPYGDYFGGVNIFTYEQFNAVNGFVNTLRGWGAEDDILLKSFIAKGFNIERRVCEFESLPHTRSMVHANYSYNLEVLKRERDFSDGISSLKYEVKNIESNAYFQKISVVF